MPWARSRRPPWPPSAAERECAPAAAAGSSRRIRVSDDSDGPGAYPCGQSPGTSPAVTVRASAMARRAETGPSQPGGAGPEPELSSTVAAAGGRPGPRRAGSRRPPWPPPAAAGPPLRDPVSSVAVAAVCRGGPGPSPAASRGPGAAVVRRVRHRLRRAHLCRGKGAVVRRVRRVRRRPGPRPSGSEPSSAVTMPGGGRQGPCPPWPPAGAR